MWHARAPCAFTYIHLRGCVFSQRYQRLQLPLMSGDFGPAQKKARRESRFKAEWKTYGVSASKKGASYAHCDSCNTDFSVAHAGVNDVKKHVSTAKHQHSLREVVSMILPLCSGAR